MTTIKTTMRLLTLATALLAVPAIGLAQPAPKPAKRGMEPVETGLPVVKTTPFEWATRGGDTLYTSQIPIKPDGSIETGDISAQAELTFQNLKKTLEAAGGGMGDVTLLLIFITDFKELGKINQVYERAFSKPYPNRATMVVTALAVPNMRFEVIAYAHIPR